MDHFKEKSGEKALQRRRRFLQFLRDIPLPKGTYDPVTRKWVTEIKKEEQK